MPHQPYTQNPVSEKALPVLTRRPRPPPAPIACHYFSRELHFRVGAPLYPGSQWNQCSFTAHHAPSIIRRTPFRFRLGHHHQPSATIATTADAHPLRVLHFTPDSSFTFYTRSHCALAIPPVLCPVVARRFDKRC